MKSIEKNYLKLIWLCCFAYAVSYMGRLAYNTNIENVITSYGVSKGTAGYVTSAFFFCYGAGQLINGIICGKFDSKKIVTLSLLFSSVIAVVMFFVKNIYVMAVLWGVNGLALSTLWCNCINILAIIRDEKYIKKSVVVMSMALPIGTIIAYGLSALLTYLNVWEVYYIISAIVVACGAILFYLSLNSVQNKINNEYMQDVADSVKENEKEINDDSNKISLIKFLKTAIIPIALLCIISNLIKDGITTWMPSYLKDNYSLPNYFSILITLLVPLLGITASMIARFVVDKTKNIFFANVIFFSISTIMLIIISLVVKLPLVILILFFMLLSTLNHSNSAVLTAIFPLYNKDIIKSGRTAGIMNAFSYIGTTISSFGLGSIVDNFGWKVGMTTLCVCAGLSILLSLWGHFYTKKEKN